MSHLNPEIRLFRPRVAPPAPTAESPLEESEQRSSRLRGWWAAYRQRRAIIRAFHRDERAFERAYAASWHDPSTHRELRAIRTLRS